jgi:hypothetical protein
MYGKTMFFMVMQSVFDTNLQIHERFDLKGSWVGRLEGRKPTGTKAKCKFCNKKYIVGGSHNQICEVRGGDGNLRHQYDQVGKDLNWNHHMALPKESAKKVAKQLFLDSNFLSKMNCIDYSLLVGVHHRRFNVSHYSSADNFDIYGDRVSRTGGIPVSTHGSTRGSTVSGSTSRMSGRSVRNTDENHPSSSSPEVSARESINNSHIPGIHQVTSKPFHQATLGGMSVDEVHGPGIYFMGLIDILQQWNFRKRLEHFIRVYLLRQDKKGISVVNPKEYAERFQQRVVRELIYDASSHERAVIYPIRLTTPMAQVPVFIPPHNTQIQEPIQSAIALDNEDSSSFAATTRMNMEALLPISVNNTLPRRRPRSTASWGNRRSSNASPIPIRLSSVSPRPSALFPTTTYRCSRNSFDMVYPSYVDYCLPPVYSNLSPSSSAKSNTACDTRNSMISIGRTSEEEEEEEEMIEYDKSQSQGSRMGLGLSSASASPSPCSTRDFIGLSLDEKEEEEEEEVFSSSSSSSSSSSNVPVQDDDGNDYRIVHSPIYPEKSIQPTRSA